MHKVKCSLIFASLLLAQVASAGGTHAGAHSTQNGIPGKAKQVNRTIDIKLNDTMRFSPDRIEVKAGETIRFKLENLGKLKHEFVLGSAQELKEHAEQMKKFPEMEHEDANALELEAGKSGELIWKFTRAGQVDFACLIPGHFDAGMKGQISVKASK